MLVLLMFVVVIWPFTFSIKEEPVDNNCSHVTVSSMFGVVTHIDTVVCGDEKVEISFGKPETKP